MFRACQRNFFIFLRIDCLFLYKTKKQSFKLKKRPKPMSVMGVFFADGTLKSHPAE